MGSRAIGVRWIASIAAAAAVATSCSTATPTSPSIATTTGAHTVPQIIMIMDGHAIPEELTIAVGERVSFMNHDRTPYSIAGGQEPSSSDCPEVNVVGVLASGDTRITEPFTAAKMCDFRVSRDAAMLGRGRIIIR
jgi:hypothetical protein